MVSILCQVSFVAGLQAAVIFEYAANILPTALRTASSCRTETRVSYSFSHISSTRDKPRASIGICFCGDETATHLAAAAAINITSSYDVFEYAANMLPTALPTASSYRTETLVTCNCSHISSIRDIPVAFLGICFCGDEIVAHLAAAVAIDIASIQKRKKEDRVKPVASTGTGVATASTSNTWATEGKRRAPATATQQRPSPS